MKKGGHRGVDIGCRPTIVKKHSVIQAGDNDSCEKEETGAPKKNPFQSPFSVPLCFQIIANFLPKEIFLLLKDIHIECQNPKLK